jgi:hypothetical protein
MITRSKPYTTAHYITINNYNKENSLWQFPPGYNLCTLFYDALIKWSSSVHVRHSGHFYLATLNYPRHPLHLSPSTTLYHPLLAIARPSGGDINGETLNYSGRLKLYNPRVFLWLAVDSLIDISSLLLPAWEFFSDWWINSGGVVRAVMDIPESAELVTTVLD